MRRRNRRIREIILGIVLLFILWQIWSKVHLYIFIPMPWWGIPLIVIVLMVILDLVLDRVLGGD